jgi:F-box/leucine-rich repeat protein 10/11
MNGNDQSIQHQHGDDVDSAMRRLSEALGGSNHVQTPPVFQMQVPPQASIQAEVHHIPDDHDQNSLPIDPSLSAMYCDPNDPTVFASHEHQFANTDRVHAFEMPSLEQIASEVLDMNGGHGHPDEGFAAQETEDHQLHALKHDTENITADLKSELHKPDGSVDSAISLAASDSLDKTPPVSSPDTSINAEQLSGPIQRSVELNNAISASESAAPAAEHTASIPLYRPPPPPSASPELSKRQPLLPITGSKPASAALPASTTPNKRKRDSLSEHFGSPSAHKKLHIRQTSQVSHNGEDLQPSGLSTDALAPLSEEEMESMELAKALQQDDLGLRKRSK